MGCFFSSSKNNSKKRQRVEVPTTPEVSQKQNIDAVSPNVSIQSGGSKLGNMKPPLDSDIVSTFKMGSSVTDRQMLSSYGFSYIIGEAKSAFIDVQSQCRIQVTALEAPARNRAVKYEEFLSTEQIRNIDRGFFSNTLPTTALKPSEEDIAFILSPFNIETAQLANACAAETCLGLSEASVSISNEPLIMSTAQFEAV